MALLTTSLGELTNPHAYTEPLVIPEWAHHNPLDNLKRMLLIRFTEEIIAEGIERGDIKCPCHLGIGQEAIAVGTANYLKNTDYVFGTHRAHASFLAMGGSCHELLAEVLGKATGCSGGLGGSMHLIDEAHGFKGSVPIVGGTIPLATGAALAAKLSGKKAVAVCYFGDGASEEGVLHESLNLAAVYELPVMFVCENNLYSSHLDISWRQTDDSIARFAKAHHVKNVSIDGNDIFTVEHTAQELINYMRKTNKPTFLEAVTYRWRGHVGPKEDIDVGLRRSQEELQAWKRRCPVKRLTECLISSGLLTQYDFDLLCKNLRKEIDEYYQQALNDPFPDTNTLMHHIYQQPTAGAQ